jgi:modulator of FtsH protease
VSAAYDASEWSDLFVATTGATAALAGLLFVAVSINVERILAFKGLPERALETLLILLGALVVSALCLAPVAAETLGWMLLAESVVALLVVAALTRISLPYRKGRSVAVGQVMLSAVGTVPILVGAISLVAGSGGGLYWVLGGVLGAVVGAVMNAWVLLIEILR